MIDIETLTSDQKSLLLYVETRAVDHSGKLRDDQLNGIDRANLKAWDRANFVSSDKIPASGRQNDGCSMWAFLSDEAWEAAGKLRRAKSKRMFENRNWPTGR